MLPLLEQLEQLEQLDLLMPTSWFPARSSAIRAARSPSGRLRASRSRTLLNSPYGLQLPAMKALQPVQPSCAC